METRNSDAVFMRQAIALAKKGEGFVNPNPLVGAVLVKDSKVIAGGCHHKYGELHAERDALKNCARLGLSAKDATLYVTLEPCCHFGKQPPCTQAIAEAGIKKVVIGSADPNPLVAGKGIQFLREQGIQVEENFLREECDALNFIFFHYITTRTPFVALKYAMTADGKTATGTGESKWISCEASRRKVHELRNKYSAILCGIQTVLSDDPLLTCRLPQDTPSRNPLRIICDSSLRIPLESKIVQSAKDVPTIVACAFEQSAPGRNELPKSAVQKICALQNAGIEVLFCPAPSNDKSVSIPCGIESLKGIEGGAGRRKVDLRALMGILAQKNTDSVLIEGGGTINFSALEAGIVQKVYSFTAPKIFGGAAPTPVGGEGIAGIEDSFGLKTDSVCLCGDDVLIEYSVRK